MNQEKIDKWVTAYHEAGHAIATYHSSFFEITEPAIKLSGASAGNLAEAGLRGPKRDEWTVDHAREFSMISFGGYVGQMMLEELRPSWKTKQEGCDGDYEMMTEALQRFGIFHEHRAHLSKCIAIIHPRVDELKELANLIFRSTADIRKASVLAILEPSPIRRLLRWLKRLFRRA